MRPLPPPVPAPRLHGYVNEEPANCYFQPLSDDEARLVQSTQAADNPAFEVENVYLEGRRDDDGGEAIELRELRSRADLDDPSAHNADHKLRRTAERDVVYAIRRESPSDLST